MKKKSFYNLVSLTDSNAHLICTLRNDLEGEIFIHRVPYHLRFFLIYKYGLQFLSSCHPKKLDQPKDGNRLLKNLEKIREWVTEVHLIHGEKGMGWASQFGCPEDGKSIFDKRNKNLLAITYAIDSIKSNID